VNENEQPTEYECASVGQRVFARLTDLALIVGLLVGAAFVPAINREPMFLPVLLILALIYYLFCDGLFSGQGVGKRLFGIRVVDARTRKPCSVGQAGLRVVVQFIPFMPIIETVYLAIECVQRYGDKVANTYVLRIHPKPRPVENLRPIDYSRFGQTLQKPPSNDPRP
jgi:uncharacterized RDD family membrane protein YckC